MDAGQASMDAGSASMDAGEASAHAGPASAHAGVTPRSPGLAERERVGGRPLSARRMHPGPAGTRYFTLSDKRDITPRRVSV